MHQATQASRRASTTHHASNAGRTHRGAGFTLVEILIVIGIIVLLLGLSVPAFSWLTGSNSTAGAENNISAMIGRARGDALGLQRDTGVFFFVDPASQRVATSVTTIRAIGSGPDTKPAPRQSASHWPGASRWHLNKSDGWIW